MKKCDNCGKEIKIKFKIKECDDVEPEEFKGGRKYKPERVVKKRYVQKLCWDCNQNRGRLFKKKNLEPDEYSEYLSLKYDFQHNDSPKIDRYKELKKKFEIKRLQKEADELENNNKLKYTDSDIKDKKEEKKISDVFSDPGFLEF